MYFNENKHLVLEIDPPHPQVLPYFPTYEHDKPAPGVIVDYRDPGNVTGHGQRAFLTYWALRAFEESGGISLDLGSAGVHHPASLALDIYGNGETPVYGGTVSGVHYKGDAANLWEFGENSFSAILSNHLIEHLPCYYVPSSMPQEQRKQIACSGEEIETIIRDHWVRIVRQGGYIVAVVPDDQYAREVESSVLFYDTSHQHAWTAAEFYKNVVDKLSDVVDVLEYDTFDNHFSFNMVLRKR